jgi:thiamine-phosphate diphosphorylase
MAFSNPFPPLQFITGSNPRLPYAEEVREACRAGVRFIQFREKRASVESTKRMAETALTIAKGFGAWFIVNDYIEVAQSIGADGVHVGYYDELPQQARAQLGQEAIVGGTANDFNHIQSLYQQNVNYMGIGPFRYTTTKDELKPTLGFEGYQNLTQQMEKAGINIPVYAVGGLSQEDVDDILKSGVNGIAVSSAVGKQSNIYEAASSFLEKIRNTKIT